MKINYKIESLEILLNKNCILERYYILIPKKDNILKYLLSINCISKEECLLLSDQDLLNSNILTFDEIKLFRRFLSLYDVNESKLKEINKLNITNDEIISFKQLYLLPGVKETRASLYYKCGFKTLEDIAKSSPNDIIDKTNDYITKMNLDIKTPLLKEVKTHIVVAKAFTIYKID